MTDEELRQLVASNAQAIAQLTVNQRQSDERLDRFIAASEADRQASHERMDRIEVAIQANTEGLTELRQLVQSNNRFIEAFAARVDRFVATVENLTQRLDGVIATSNQDRQETNTRLSRLDRLVSAIARHLGVSS